MAKKINLEYEEKNYSEKIEKLLFLSYLVVLLLKKLFANLYSNLTVFLLFYEKTLNYIVIS